MLPNFSCGCTIKEKPKGDKVMAQKKVYFFKIKLYDREMNKELDYKLLANIAKDIIDSNSSVDGNTRIINLTFAGDLLHTTADVFRYRNDHIFMRTSRQKPTNSMIMREYSTQVAEGLLPGISEDVRGIEKYTFIYVNYEKGILAIIGAQGAPNQKIFSDIFDLYGGKYKVELLPIPNPDGIERIYGKTGTVINSVDLTVPVPDPVILETVLGVEGKKLLDEVAVGDIEVRMQITPTISRGKIVSGGEEADKLINCIKDKIELFKKASLRGKYDGVNTKSYNFYEEDFYFPVDIKEFVFAQGEKVFLPVDEFTTLNQEKLIGAYNSNKDYVIAAANRRE